MRLLQERAAGPRVFPRSAPGAPTGNTRLAEAQACAAGEGQGAVAKEAPRRERRLFLPAPSPPLRFAPLVRPKAEPSPQAGRGESALSPRCVHPLAFRGARALLLVRRTGMSGGVRKCPPHCIRCAPTIAGTAKGDDVGGIILVTGGSRGIGAAICRQAAARGYDVAINYNASPGRGRGPGGGHRARGRQGDRGAGRRHAGGRGRAHVRDHGPGDSARSPPSSTTREAPASPPHRWAISSPIRRWPRSAASSP